MVYLFSKEKELGKRIEGSFIYLFLDYDGTLAPMAVTPDKAVLPGPAHRVLRELSALRDCKVAVISGRSLKGIKRMVGLKGIVYSGNHGLEIEGPKLKFESVVPSGFRKTIKGIKAALRGKLSGIEGVILEDKGYTLSVHYRMVTEKKVRAVKAAFREAVAYYLVSDKIRVKTGKMVLEVSPPVEWDKGKSVLWLLARQQLEPGVRPVLAVYAGDDVTDEDAFAALGDKGITVYVGGTGKSKARYYLKDHDDVVRFLVFIRDIKRGRRYGGSRES